MMTTLIVCSVITAAIGVIVALTSIYQDKTAPTSHPPRPAPVPQMCPHCGQSVWVDADKNLTPSNRESEL